MTTYYTDNSGSDGDGSFSYPWNNIAGHVDDLSPLDMMYVRGAAYAPGRIYTESTIEPTISGSSGNLITVQPYPGEHVIIQTTGIYVLRFNSVNYWYFNGFSLDRQSSWDAAPITRNVRFSSADHNILRNCKIYNAGIGVLIGSGDYNLVDNCDIYDNGTGAYAYAGTGHVISNNTIYDNHGDGIQFYNGGSAIVDAIIEDNHIYTTIGKCSENGIDIKNGNVTIRRNTLHGFRYCDATCGGSGGGIGEAIIVHIDGDNSIIEDNIIYDCTSGISVHTDNITVRRNLIHELVVDLSTGGWGCIGIYVYGANHVDLFNNTIHDTPDHSSCWSLYFAADAQDVDMRNNLFYETGAIEEEAGSDVTADYNGWFDVIESISGAHDTTGSGDPGFVDAANGDFHLQPGSPAIDAGVDLGYPYRGTAPDLGTHEFLEETIAGGTTPAGAVVRRVGKVLGGMV